MAKKEDIVRMNFEENKCTFKIANTDGSKVSEGKLSIAIQHDNPGNQIAFIPWRMDNKIYKLSVEIKEDNNYWSGSANITNISEPFKVYKS